MPDPWRVVTAVAGALALAGALAAVGARSARRDAALAGVAALAACAWGAMLGLALSGSLPRVPPVSVLDRLLLVLLPAVLAIELEVAGGWLGGGWISAERALLSLVATPVLLHGSVWLDGRAGVWPAILAAALFLWAAWEGIAGQVAGAGDRVVPGVTVAALVAAGAAIAAGGWLKGGIVPVVLAGALAGALLAARAGGGRNVSGVAALSGKGLVALFGTTVAGCCFGRMRLESALLLLLAPLAASVPAGISRLLPESGPTRVLGSTRYRVALAAVPLLAVLVAAKGDSDALLRGVAARQDFSGHPNVRQNHPSDARDETSSSPLAP